MLNIKQKARTFFESSPSYNDGYLEVGGGHSIYYEEYGNPNGKPVLFLHGGPGAGFSNSHKGFFDPKIFGADCLNKFCASKLFSAPFLKILLDNLRLSCWDTVKSGFLR